MIDRPPGRDEADWAAKIHVALAPVYYHNYVLGYSPQPNSGGTSRKTSSEVRTSNTSSPADTCRRPSLAPAPATTGGRPRCAPPARN